MSRTGRARPPALPTAQRAQALSFERMREQGSQRIW
ncbi:hypothetical protein CYFUS_008771 [Cystobacter fuscus]|uniref:Uncharacterized protein n=1 Tax=Cystobacter fuscus TaxID=43 RepID=A0A250JIT8_9BACT|nr:hypothetical protein CYFUS_008771 [Cystobacter fuscus]